MDFNLLKGAIVRDIYGARGCVVDMNDEVVQIAWDLKTSTKVESIPIDDERLDVVVEILTLDRGWCPFNLVPRLRIEERPRGRIDNLVEEIRGLMERSKHWPFKRRKRIGPGPDQQFGTRRVSRKDKWTCKCKDYVCQCKKKGGGRKTVRIDRGYKADYNRAYKAWRKD